jgi:hypothetical protein
MIQILIPAMDSALARVTDVFETYRDGLQRIISTAKVDLRYESMRRLAEVASQYREAIEQIKLSHAQKRIRHYLAYSRYLLHIEKTIAGLLQLIVQHAVRKSPTSFLTFSLLCRVRQLTITHPAIAPPQFV